MILVEQVKYDNLLFIKINMIYSGLIEYFKDCNIMSNLYTYVIYFCYAILS